MKYLFLIFSLACIFRGFSQNQFLFIGTYDSPKSEGVYVYQFNSLNGTAKEISRVKTSNPSYIAISPNKKNVYSVNENADQNGKGGSVTSFAFDKATGHLTKINTQSSEGNHPCYVTIDNSGRWLFTANYSSGNFAVLPVNNDGALRQAHQTIQQEGKGFDTARQKSPHVHGTFLSKNNKILYVTDLGTDKVMMYDFDRKTGKVQPSQQKFIATSAGTGPRHLDISANNKFLYVLQELKGIISTYTIKNNFLKEIQTISSVPSNFNGFAGSADIHISPDGKYLYASNRGESNTIAIYKINKNTGTLSLTAHQSTLGIAPRNFNFDPSGKYLLVANQNSDEVVIFKRDIITGLLTNTGNRIAIGKPVCLKWM